jgi:hypothetical protein
VATKEERRMQYAVRIWRGWRNRLHRIDREIDGLSQERRTMQYTIDQIVHPNQRIMEHSNRRFLNDVWSWYGISMGIAVRRLVDTDRRTKSLVVLLQSIRAHPDVFHIDIFSQIFPASRDDLKQLIKPVSDASGEGLDLAAVTNDLDHLKKTTKRVCDWVNDFIAHGRYLEDPAAQVALEKTVPKYVELHDAIDAIENVALKYARIFLKHDRLPYDVAEIDADLWLSIFDFPWKPSDKPGRSNRP